jgi:hypothetical protein
MSKKSSTSNSTRSGLPVKKSDPKMTEALKALKNAGKKPGGAMTRSNYDD